MNHVLEAPATCLSANRSPPRRMRSIRQTIPRRPTPRRPTMNETHGEDRYWTKLGIVQLLASIPPARGLFRAEARRGAETEDDAVSYCKYPRARHTRAAREAKESGSRPLCSRGNRSRGILNASRSMENRGRRIASPGGFFTS